MSADGDERREAMMRLRVLIVEDNEDDAALVLRELRRAGFEVEAQRVDTADGLNRAIDAGEWDLVLADFSMPGFGGKAALEVVRGRGVDAPYIFVSGSIGEETAAGLMRAGAQDYVLKDNLIRLIPAVERELREAAMRRERARIESEHRAAQARFGQVLATAADAVVAIDSDHRITLFNRAAEAMF
ncbi:MAG: response regulator, partial [Rhodospirillaceae bacterium]|nr:response regulator [Rhodospirillaceae bacterium]